MASKKLPIQGQFFWADHFVSLVFACLHSLILGVTGAGKGILQRAYLASLVPQVLRSNSRMRAFLFDPKREQVPLLSSMGVPLKAMRILHPLDARCYALDLARDFSTLASARELPKLLIPTRKNETQPFFPNTARHFVNGVLEVFLTTSRGKWTLRDLVLATRYPERLKEILMKTPDSRRFLGYFANEMTFQNIKATLDVSIAEFEVIAALWHGRPQLSLTEWVRESGSFLIMGCDPTLHSVIDPLNQLTFNRLAQLLLSLDEVDVHGTSCPYTFINLDEVASAGKLDMLSRLMREGRSKGVGILLAVQMLYSLKELYGDHVALEIVSQCSNRAILRLSDPDTADLASRWIGEAEFEEKTVGATRQAGGREDASTNINYSVVRLPRVIPCQLWEDFPPVSEINAVPGFFYSPGLAEQTTFETRIGLEGLENAGLLTRPSEEVPAFVKRPDEDQVLQDWTVEDLDRLGLINPLSAEESIRDLLCRHSPT